MREKLGWGSGKGTAGYPPLSSYEGYSDANECWHSVICHFHRGVKDTHRLLWNHQNRNYHRHGWYPVAQETLIYYISMVSQSTKKPVATTESPDGHTTTESPDGHTTTEFSNMSLMTPESSPAVTTNLSDIVVRSLLKVPDIHSWIILSQVSLFHRPQRINAEDAEAHPRSSKIPTVLEKGGQLLSSMWKSGGRVSDAVKDW